MKEINKFVDDAIYPAARSAGGDNAFYIQSCPAVQHSPAYAVCLNRIRMKREGQIDLAIHSDCNQAIGRRTCAAVHMLEEEELKGQAVYFVSRDKMRDFHGIGQAPEQEARDYQPDVGRAFLSSAERIPTREQPATPKTPQSASQAVTSGGSYADAINAAILNQE